MKTILDAVLSHSPQRPCVTWYSKGHSRTITFGDVSSAMKAAAANLAAHGVKRGDIVVMVGTHHLDFYAIWLGAVWLGAVPTVLAEPSVRIDKQLYVQRLDELLKRIDARVLAVDPKYALSLPHQTYEQLTQAAAEVPPRASSQPQDVVLLQHSSGTTGAHKGVMLTHQAVMHHAKSYLPAANLKQDSVVASWLPLYHDMGLIACFVTPLIVGAHVVWLSPFEWVVSPSLLLKAVAEYRATHVWLPNFAFLFLAQRTRESFDLSTLEAVVNCSEPITAEAMDAFVERFQRDGFKREALQTCYAMAENVFAVSSTQKDHSFRRMTVNTDVFRDEHRAVPAASGREWISSGRVVEDCEVRVADASGKALAPGHAGRLLIRSPFLLRGYFRRDDLNPNLLDAEGFYDTGDLGFVDDDGHVYVTGRAKDLIIVGGRNIYPQDIEQIANEVSGVHPGRAVCFGVRNHRLETEGLILLAESDLSSDEWRSVEQRLKATIPARLDVDLLDVRVVKEATLRKSTSGKLQRSGNREWYLEGRFGPIPAHLEGE